MGRWAGLRPKAVSSTAIVQVGDFLGLFTAHQVDPALISKKREGLGPSGHSDVPPTPCTHRFLPAHWDSLWALGKGSGRGSERGPASSWRAAEEEVLGVMLNRLASALLGQCRWSLPLLSLREATGPRGRSGPSGCPDKPGSAGGRRVLALWPSGLALRTVAIVLPSMSTPTSPPFTTRSQETRALWVPGRAGHVQTGVTAGL